MIILYRAFGAYFMRIVVRFDDAGFLPKDRVIDSARFDEDGRAYVFLTDGMPVPVEKWHIMTPGEAVAQRKFEGNFM